MEQADLKKKVEQLLHKQAGSKSSIKDILKLHGDASYRTYYRVILDDKKTYILMQMPQGKASVSEEITNFNGTHKELPYINVSRYLEKHGVKVPHIYYYSKEDHFIILEDLGEKLMSKLVENADDDIKKDYYKRAIDLLVDMQLRTANSSKFECVALQRSFDAVLYNWEFAHFLEYGMEVRLDLEVSKADKDTFISQTRNLSDTISELPYGFTHRDFQSRNILIVKNNLYLIDFQDALLGPAAYDLVSLLRDSYVKLSDVLFSELISYYCGKKDFDLVSFKNQFDLITVQRKLKDAGRFVFIDRIKRNPSFLKYVPTSLGYARQALERLPEYTPLYEMIKKYVPEWK